MTQIIVSPEQELLAQLLAKLQELEPYRQEQVLDFIEFLLSRQHQAHTQEQPIESKAPISALEALGDFVGCIEAPSDLSMRKKLLKHKAIARRDLHIAILNELHASIPLNPP